MFGQISRKGKIDSDSLYVFSFTIVFLIIVISSSLYCSNNYIVMPYRKNIITDYNNINTLIRTDVYKASFAKIATETMVFLDNNSNKLSEYELKNKNLIRYDKEGKASVIFENIESASFTNNKDLPNLVTVRIYPSDKKEIPFFTSFALRGYSNDK